MRREHLRTLEAVFRHPPAGNLEWTDVVALIDSIGVVHQTGGGSFRFEIGGELFSMHKPHTKDLTVADVADLRHFLNRAGWSPEAVSPGTDSEAPTPMLVVAIDHGSARIYRVDATSADPSRRQIRPYDPHHFLHHLTHRDQSREQGQRAPEDPSFYEAVAQALRAGGAIVVVGHGTGKSNAAQHLMEYLRTHHRETCARVVREIDADLSAITPPQLLALAEEALEAAS